MWSVSLAKLSVDERTIILKNKKRVFKDFISLMNDHETFVSSITSGTGDKTRVIYRFSAIEELLKKIITDDNGTFGFHRHTNQRTKNQKSHFSLKKDKNICCIQKNDYFCQILARVKLASIEHGNIWRIFKN